MFTETQYNEAVAVNEQLDELLKTGQFDLVTCLPCGIDEETARRMGG